MAAFLDEIIFPVHISKGSTGGPQWQVEIVTLASGREERNTPWSAPLRSYDARWAVRSKSELYEILELYHVSMGALKGFRMLDWTDYMSCTPDQTPSDTDQPLGVGDGATASFDLFKKYQVQSHQFNRRINKPFGNILVAIDDVAQAGGFTVDPAVGSITFDTPPSLGQTLSWGGYFHVPVRFDGKLDATALQGEYGEIPSIPLRELKL